MDDHHAILLSTDGNVYSKDKLLDPTCVPGYYTIPSVNRDGDEFSQAFLGKSKKTIHKSESSKKESPHKKTYFLAVTLRQNQFAKKQKGLLNLISISKLKLRTLLKKRLKSCIAVLFEMPKGARLEAKKEEILNREIE
ncbi:hypothetical protein Tco_1259801, partial [Tanacetum coccineum]